MEQSETGICVIGAGLIGLATAWSLLQRGHQVTIVDPDRPGHGASFGNAATLATYAVAPIAHPGLWARMPGLLFSDTSPFRIRWQRLPRLAPWLFRFLRETSPGRASDNAMVLCRFLEPALEDWRALLADIEADGLLLRRGCLYFHTDSAGMRGAQGEIAMRDRLGVHQQILSADDVARLEPSLAGRSAGGVLFPDAAHVNDPLAVSQALASAIACRGGHFLEARVTGLRGNGAGVVVATDQGELAAERAVVAAGAWSGSLARMVGDRIPLDTERGYHLEFPMDTPLLERPCCPVERAFYMTPLSGRLRVAGTVELGSIDDAASEERFRFLQAGAESILGRDLGEPSSRWLGFRPSMPDSLPVIGPSGRNDRVIYAFGHGHLGLTMAATTGRLVADVIAGTAPEWLAGCSAARFY
ncbi:MAG: FAD-dependent oxidoreductase [Aquisalimonadaceae bacterium]